MRYLRFTLLQSYILSIQKNKRKALLLINFLVKQNLVIKFFQLMISILHIFNIQQ